MKISKMAKYYTKKLFNTNIIQIFLYYIYVLGPP